MNQVALAPWIIAASALLGDVGAAQSPSSATDASVVEWLRKDAVPLTGTDPGKGGADLAAMKEWLAPARVIGIGEASQGAHEFFRVKHKLVEFLIAQCGVTTVVLESSWPETMAIDHWIHGGPGDPKALLAGLHFWNTDTQEMLEFVTALRAWNHDPAHARKVKLVGADVQLPAQSVAGAAEFIQHVAPDEGDRFLQVVGPLAELTANLTYPRLAPTEQDRTRAGLEEFAKLFETNADAWTKATSADDCALARRALEQVIRAERDFREPAFHDEALAENVRDALTDDGADGRVVFWSHNVHVAAALPGSPLHPSGQFLREWFGEKYVAVGLEFERGAFIAVGPGPDGAPALHEFTIGAPPEDSVPALFERAGSAVFAIDLRAAPASGPVRDWLDHAAAAHSIGGLFDAQHEDAAFIVAPLAPQFDVMVFVRRTLAARPL